MINLVVNKIGGSILKSPSQLNKTVSIILASQSVSIFVVSALYGVTDQLINATKRKCYKKHLQSIKNTHLKWLTDSSSTKNLKEAIISLQRISKNLETDLQYFKTNQNPHIYARIVSAGERLASVIIKYYVNCNAEILLPEKIGLQTSNNAFKSEYLTNASLSKKLTISYNQKYIMPGFYGINEFDQHCLTGRGGSDYTAAFLAKLFSAEKLIFWKDSNGIQTANPEIVTNAENVADINLHVLNQMSKAGSKILHPKVTYTLHNFSGHISFRNPVFGDQILTNIHTQKSSSGKAIIIDAPSMENNKKCTISIITRNKTAALIAIQQLKNIFSGIHILDISEQIVSFETREKNRAQVIRNLHDSFHLKRSFSLQKETISQNHLTL